MRRLIFILILGVLLAAPFATDAEQRRTVSRIGVLTIVPGPTPRTEALRRGLQELGYVEGKNLVIHWQWAAGKIEKFPDLAADLVRLNVDLIVAGGPPAILAAKNAAAAIPIVMVAAADPVRSGLVKSLARPGGNITGLSYEVTSEIGAKALELLSETVSNLSIVGVLWNSAEPGAPPYYEAVSAGGSVLKITIKPYDVRTTDGIEDAFAAMRTQQVRAILVVPGLLTYAHRQRIVDLAVKSRLPAIFGFEEITEAGGLMSYGPSLA
ncbi:MAG: ABC transporter substrate-binding protein, partial [Candidatus Rokubacteria bacterium]|nr:ABC transporter substrate-binding protein [Candidatus Rokubacteria bacterium]